MIKPAQRYLALEELRGMTVALLILVNTPGSWLHIYAPLKHAAWHGCAPTDLVFPFFLFVVGIFMFFSFSKYDNSLNTESLLKIGKRSLLIFAIGLYLNSFPQWTADFPKLRIMGVLQRIALAYGIGAVIVLACLRKYLSHIGAVILLFYWGLMYSLGGSDPFSLEGNATIPFDSAILGVNIMTYRVTTEVNDMQQLQECVKSMAEETGISPTEILADKGYSNTAQILDIEKDGTAQCYIPLIETKREKSEKKDIRFVYDKNSDTYKCHECKGCPVQDKCTKSKTGRILKRNVDQDRIDQYKEKIAVNYAKEKIRERKQVVEHPFGTIKMLMLMGKFNLLLKGKIKAQIEFDYYTATYNLKRLICCAPIMELMNKMENYRLAKA